MRERQGEGGESTEERGKKKGRGKDGKGIASVLIESEGWDREGKRGER